MMRPAPRPPSPIRRIWISRTGTALLLCLSWVVSSLAQNPGNIDAPVSDIVLLKNGQHLFGKARVSVDRTTVETASGSQIVLKTSDVLIICQTWQQAWEFKRDSVDVEKHQELAELMQWCIRCQLFPQAWEVIDQLQHSGLSASELNSLHRQLTSAEKSWQIAQRPRPLQTETEAIVATAEITPELVAVEQIQSIAAQPQEQQVLDNAVQQASFESLESKSAPLPSAVIPSAELDFFAGQIPEKVVTGWRREIEPALLAGCATAGCHAPGSKTMPLMSIGQGLSVPSRMSQQNLYRTAEFLLHEPNSMVRCLTAAANAHGNGTTAPMKLEGKEFVALERWVREFGTSVPATAVRNQVVSNTDQPVPTIGPRPESFETQPAPPLPIESEQLDAKPIPTIPPDLPSIPELNAVSQRFIPRDEFDPELFNRHFMDSSSESGRIARALGFPDLQSVIGKQKSPAK